jgi:hypothetical protein
MPYMSYIPAAAAPVQRPLRAARAAAGKRARKYRECIVVERGEVRRWIFESRSR